MKREELLTSLGFSVNESLKAQIDVIAQNTSGFDILSKHIVQLHDSLKVCGGHVAMSNNSDYLKIKIEANRGEAKEECAEKIKHWCEKYKVEVKEEQHNQENVYYIIGHKG